MKEGHSSSGSSEPTQETLSVHGGPWLKLRTAGCFNWTKIAANKTIGFALYYIIIGCLIMADVHSVERRSHNMSRIKSKNTKPEILVRKFLHAQGFRYRLHSSKLPGKPDLVLLKLKTVIFINGCFWHGHENCKYYHVPKTKTEWWLEKIYRNKARDFSHIKNLKALVWNIIVIWECNLKKGFLPITLNQLLFDL